MSKSIGPVQFGLNGVFLFAVVFGGIDATGSRLWFTKLGVSRSCGLTPLGTLGKLGSVGIAWYFIEGADVPGDIANNILGSALAKCYCHF